MNHLILDCSTEILSLTLKTDTHQYTYHEHTPKKHNEEILAQIDTLLKKSNLRPSALSQISYGKGPGSFVGVRIAASVATGLSEAFQIPLATFSSFHASALNYYAQYPEERQPIELIMDAKMRDLYIGHYNKIDDNNIIEFALYSIKKHEYKPSPNFQHIQAFIAPQTKLINIEHTSTSETLPLYLQGTQNWQKL